MRSRMGNRAAGGSSMRGSALHALVAAAAASPPACIAERAVAAMRMLLSAGVPLEALDDSGASALVLALNLRQGALVDVLYEAGASLHYKLHFAAHAGFVEVARELLAAGAPVDLLDEEGMSPLATACRRGHPGVAQVLLDAGANIQLECQGQPLLRMAAERGHAEVVRRLLAAGADGSNAGALDKRTALHAAAAVGDLPTVQLLLAAEGAPVNAGDKDGCTPLHLATEKGHVAVLQALAAHKDAAPNLLDAQCRTPLVAAVLCKNLAAVKALQAARADMGFRLHHAAHHGHIQQTKDLLNEGVPLGLREPVRGKTPLHIAAERSQDEVVFALLEAGAHVDAQDDASASPAMLAAGLGHDSTLRLLQGHSASVRLLDAQRRSALHHAAAGGHAKCVSLLLGELESRRAAAAAAAEATAASAEKTAVMAARGAREAAVQAPQPQQAQQQQRQDGSEQPAAAAGPDSASQDFTFASASLSELAATASRAYKDAATAASAAAMLMAASAVELINCQDVQGRTALSDAAAGGHVQVLALLLAASASLLLPDLQGDCPLHRAAAEGRTDAVQQLLSMGAPLNVANNEGLTPLHYACKGGHVVVVEYLMSAGARTDLRTAPNKQNDESVTPFLMAASSGQAEVVELFLARSKDPKALVAETDGTGNTALGRCIRAANPKAEGHPEKQPGLKVARALFKQGCSANQMQSAGMPMLVGVAATSTTEMAELFLENGADIQLVGRNHRHPLHAAAKKGMTRMCTRFLDLYPGAVNLQDATGSSALHEAVADPKLSNDATARLLVERGAALDVRDKAGRTPLCIATSWGRVGVVSMLLEAGADATLKDHSGQAPVHIAATKGHMAVLKVLLESAGGAAMKLLPTSSGRTALHAAAGAGQAAVAEYLLMGEHSDTSIQAGIDANQPSLHPKASATAAFLNMCKQLLQQGTILTYQGPQMATGGPTSFGSTALADIPKRGLVYFEVTVLEGSNPAGLAVGLTEDTGRTNLFPGLATYLNYQAHCMYGLTGNHSNGPHTQNEQYGFKYGKGDVVGVLVNRAYRTVSFTLNGRHLGVSSRDVDLSGLKLFVAVKLGEPAGTALDVNFGDRPFSFNMDDLLIQEEGRLNPGDLEPWKFKEQVYPIHMAACSGSVETLATLLAHHARAEQADATGWLALHFAALKGWHEGIRMLLGGGGAGRQQQQQAQATDGQGGPAAAAAAVAAAGGPPAGAGAAAAAPAAVTAAPAPAPLVNARTTHRSTPLQLAVKNSHSEAARTLLECGADHQVKDDNGRTLLMLASERGNLELMTLLISKGVLIKAKDSMGRTAMQYACNEAVISHLEAALNQVNLYRSVFEINNQVDTKYGAQGQVIMAKHTLTGNSVAIKFHKNEAVRNFSAAVISRLDRKFVAGVPLGMSQSDWMFNDVQKHPMYPYALVIEGGDVDLQQVLDEQGSKPLPENQCRFIFECIAQAVDHVHSHDLVHHDLKARNLVRFFDGRYRLIDFDNSRERDSQPFGNTTIDICPPEVAQAMLDEGERSASRPDMDMWALGCLLYQLIMSSYLLADLAEQAKLPWKDDIFSRDPKDGPLQLWASLVHKQDLVDKLLEDRMAKRRHIRLAEHAYSLLGHLLQVDPRKRFTIDAVLGHAFLRGGNTKTMDDQALEGIRTRVNVLNTKIDAIASRVIAIHERTLQLSELPQQMQEAFRQVGKQIAGVRKLVVNTKAAECPSMFVIVPDIPMKEALLAAAGRAVGAAVGGAATSGGDVEGTLDAWVTGLQATFSGQLSLGEVAKRLTHKRYRLKLVCETCMAPCGDGYVIEKAAEWTAKLMPAMKVSFTVAKTLNFAAGIAKFVFPGVPVIPDDIMGKCRGMLDEMQAASSAAAYACIQTKLDETTNGLQSMDAGSDLAPAKQVEAATRQLQAFLVKEDPSRTWAGLSMVQASGDEGGGVMWVCPACLSSDNATGGGGGGALQERCAQLEAELAALRQQLGPAAAAAAKTAKAAVGKGIAAAVAVDMGAAAAKRAVHEAVAEAGEGGCFSFGRGSPARVHPQ